MRSMKSSIVAVVNRTGRSRGASRSGIRASPPSPVMDCTGIVIRTLTESTVIRLIQ